MNFTERVQAAAKTRNSLLCVGLDPDFNKLPSDLKTEPDALFKFCSEIIASTQHVALAFKLNFAFFEAEGTKGWAALERLVSTIPDGILKIADAKRADIGNTSAMYAHAILERMGFDAVTVNPYMGRDSVEPFLQWPDKGIFLLCVTSNPGNQDFQYFTDGSTPLYRRVLDRVLDWNQKGNCGVVVGATQPQELDDIRAAAPGLPFLIPGIGTQGGELETSVSKGTDADGSLALFNVSRGILYKSAGPDFAEAARKEAESLAAQINRVRIAKQEGQR